MAGVFKLSPLELVDGTTYPRAKAERLPELTATYTELELNFAILNNDLLWLERLNDPGLKLKSTQALLDKWIPLLKRWTTSFNDEHETNILLKMRQILKELIDQVNHYLT